MKGFIFGGFTPIASESANGIQLVQGKVFFQAEEYSER
jgi:hypothetical protein